VDGTSFKSLTAVVGVEGSAASDAAIRWTARVAVMRSLPTTLAHVAVPTMMSSTMETAIGGEGCPA
jgi:nucleotide-binding universal stress UspA family protein